MGNNNVKLPSQIDSVTAAQYEYDFLRIVDEHKALYQDAVICNAIYRYERYWLPLAAEHLVQFLQAPLDIEWVWHCHLLNPFQYRKDCRKIVSKVVDHLPYKLCEANKPLSQKYWNKKYGNVPFDVDLKEFAPSLIDPSYRQKIWNDIAGTIRRQLFFNYNTSLPHCRDKKFLSKAAWRYYIMLQIKKEHPNTFTVSLYDIDLIWYAHQQYPLAYAKDTLSILGETLDHDDITIERGPRSDFEKGIESTRKLWKQKGHKFQVPGALHRGEPPLPQDELDQASYLSLAEKVRLYIFYILVMFQEAFLRID